MSETSDNGVKRKKLNKKEGRPDCLLINIYSQLPQFIRDHGDFQRKACGIRVWVVAMSILMLAALVCIVVLCVMHGLSSTGSDIFLSFVEGLIFFLVMAYCILCVNSYYLMLKSSEDMEGPPKTIY